MGSRAFVPPIEGFGLAGTGVLRKADDAIRMRAFAQRHGAKKAAVAGGGLLGLEAAYALHQLGMKATVLERSDRLLKRQLDAARGRAAAALPRGPRPGDRDRAPRPRPSPANGRLDSSSSPTAAALDTELLLVAAGIQPNAELAKAAGLATNRGVLVDARMQTGDPHDPRGRRRRRVRGPGARACGRPRSPRPRSRPTSPSAGPSSMTRSSR